MPQETLDKGPPRERPARQRQEIPPPEYGNAGVTLTVYLPALTAAALTTEVLRRNQQRALSRDWTVERLLEAIIKEKFPS